jgi:uncharacterized protein (TIGR03000 family)
MIGRYPLIRSAVLASALLLFAAQPGVAQGGHGGGGHGGGGHGGGSFSGHAGSWHGGDFHHDGHFHDGHFHDHNSFAFGLYFYPWWGWGWPGYGWGGYYGAGWYDYPTYYGYYGNVYGAAPDYSGYQAARSGNDTTSSATEALSPNAVALRILVPKDAQIWIQGEATKQQGPVRIFKSRELTPGVEYIYHIRAQWTEGGRQVERNRQVRVHAGDRLTLPFTQAPKPATAPMPRESR